MDTSGAGDAFAGSLAFFYCQLGGGASTGIDGATLVEAAWRASVVAGVSVTRKGTQRSYATRAELPPHLFESGTKLAQL